MKLTLIERLIVSWLIPQGEKIIGDSCGDMDEIRPILLELIEQYINDNKIEHISIDGTLFVIESVLRSAWDI